MEISLFGGRATLKWGNAPTSRGGTGGYDSPNDSSLHKARANTMLDASHVMSDANWQKMIADSRFIFRLPLVIASAKAKAQMVCSGKMRPLYAGSDHEWGKRAQELLHANAANVDVRGFNYNFHGNYERVVLALIRDGAIYRLNVSGKDSFPLSQWFEAHRIGSRGLREVKADGPYKGMEIVGGHIISKTGRTVAYQVLGNVPADDTIIPARFMQCITSPATPTEIRGWPELAPAVETFWSAREFKQREQIKQVLASSLSIVESTPSGLPSSGPNSTTTVGTDADGNALKVKQDSFFPGLIRFIQSGRGKIEIPKTDTPSMDTQAFLQTLQQEAVAGMGWRIEHITNTGGSSAANHAVAAQINGIAAHTFDFVSRYAVSEIQWRVASHIARGDLTASDDWWRWNLLQPRKYSPNPSRATMQKLKEYELGLCSGEAYAMEINGELIDDVITQRARELQAEDVIIDQTGVDPLDLYNTTRFDRRMTRAGIVKAAEQDLANQDQQQ